MSTFLTQGSYPSTAITSGGQSKSSKDPSAANAHQLQSSLLYAPFVKPTDKVRVKDAADLSFSDFQPKRFALNYDPPMISK